jgi:hypothetical protein
MIKICIVWGNKKGEAAGTHPERRQGYLRSPRPTGYEMISFSPSMTWTNSSCFITAVYSVAINYLPFFPIITDILQRWNSFLFRPERFA